MPGLRQTSRHRTDLILLQNPNDPLIAETAALRPPKTDTRRVVVSAIHSVAQKSTVPAGSSIFIPLTIGGPRTLTHASTGS